MSIFVTSLGATDNEICAPLTHEILNNLNKKGFKFRGIPAVESRILINSNEVSYALRTCKIKTQQVTFKFDEVYDFTSQYRIDRSISPKIQFTVERLLCELEELASHCTSNCSCSDCVVTHSEPIPDKLTFTDQ